MAPVRWRQRTLYDGVANLPSLLPRTMTRTVLAFSSLAHTGRAIWHLGVVCSAALLAR